MALGGFLMTSGDFSAARDRGSAEAVTELWKKEMSGIVDIIPPDYPL